MTVLYPRKGPSKSTIQIYQGESLDQTCIRLTNPDGTPYNVSGVTSHMVVRSTPGGTSILDLSTSNGGIVVVSDGYKSLVRLHGSGSVTSAISPDVYYGDWRVDFPDGRSYMVWVGKFSILLANTSYP